MPSFCVVSNCELKYSHSENISFHKFPVNNPEILDLWIKFTGRGTTWKPSRWSSICSRHFNRSDFRDTEFLSRKCLKRNAVPTIIMQNSISYETYHISNDPTNYNNAQTIHSNNETDEYGTISEARNNCSNEKILLEMTCRLCGERVNQFSNDDESQVPQSLDDFVIDMMIKKCLPTLSLCSDNDQSRVICSYCNSQLKQYSMFVDRVQSYQKDLIYSNSNCQDYIEANNINQISATDTLSESSNNIFIKQEPTVNVKQEKSDGFNNSRRPHDLLKNLYSTYTMPTNLQTAATKLMRPMAANFTEYLKTQTGNEREQMGNCEIMEIITLNNPVSIIDLAAEDDPTGHSDCTKKLKTESLPTSDIDRRVEVEHAYAKRVNQAIGTVHYLKQEISEIISDDLDENIGHVSEPQIPDALSPEINMKCQTIDDPPEYSPPTLMKRECPFCNAVFESVTEYLRHKTKIHRSVVRRRANRKFISKLLPNSHEHCKSIDNNHLIRRRNMDTHKENSKDKSRVYKNVSDYSGISKILTVYVSDLGKFICSFCYRLFKRAKNFAEHQEMHLKYNHQKDPKKIFTNELLLSERDVEGSSDDSRILPTNLKTLKMVVKDVQVICMNHCDLKQLTGGETLFDTQAKCIQCSLCPTSHPNKFKTISGLKQHISGFHYKIKPYFCSKCGASFSLKSDSFRCRHSRSGLAKNSDN